VVNATSGQIGSKLKKGKKEAACAGAGGDPNTLPGITSGRQMSSATPRVPNLDLST